MFGCLGGGGGRLGSETLTLFNRTKNAIKYQPCYGLNSRSLLKTNGKIHTLLFRIIFNFFQRPASSFHQGEYGISHI